MGKKKPAEMAKQRAIFVKGCKEKNNIPDAKANQIFDLLEKFAGYGFNKSHAAAYAIVAYQTAYLKANYPVEFYCAVMTNDMADTAKLSQYINDARAQDIEVLPPDVNESGVHFTAAQSVVARASRPCEPGKERTGGTPDHIVRDEQQLARFTRYIGENPLRARLPEGQYRLGAGVVARASRPSEQEAEHT